MSSQFDSPAWQPDGNSKTGLYGCLVPLIIIAIIAGGWWLKSNWPTTPKAKVIEPSVGTIKEQAEVTATKFLQAYLDKDADTIYELADERFIGDQNTQQFYKTLNRYLYYNVIQFPEPQKWEIVKEDNGQTKEGYLLRNITFTAEQRGYNPDIDELIIKLVKKGKERWKVFYCDFQ